MVQGRTSIELSVEQLREAMSLRGPSLREFIRTRLPPRFRGRVSEDDILQEVWFAAFKHRHSFRRDRPDALDRWLTSITQSRLLNTIKAEMRIKRGGRVNVLGQQNRYSRSFAGLLARVVSSGNSPSKEVAIQEVAEAIHLALSEMPEARRQAVVYRYLEGKSHDEIATLMSRTKPAVNSLIFNGLRQLQRILGPPASFLSGTWQRTDSSQASACIPNATHEVG